MTNDAVNRSRHCLDPGVGDISVLSKAIDFGSSALIETNLPSISICSNICTTLSSNRLIVNLSMFSFRYESIWVVWLKRLGWAFNGSKAIQEALSAGDIVVGSQVNLVLERRSGPICFLKPGFQFLQCRPERSIVMIGGARISWKRLHAACQSSKDQVPGAKPQNDLSATRNISFKY